MPAYPELRDPRDPMGLMDMIRQQELIDEVLRRPNSMVSKIDHSPRLLDREVAAQGRREDALASPIADAVRLRAIGHPHPMGEMVALDRYGVQPGVVGRPLPNAPPNPDRALYLAGPGTPEGEVTSGNRFPDAVSEHQRPPPKPPFFDENTPSWATEQQGTPQFWMEGPQFEPEVGA